jgi:hypothetical protein
MSSDAGDYGTGLTTLPDPIPKPPHRSAIMLG